ncbi:penicillin-binding protein activator [Alteromonas sp. 5E99-2]|uniref:penicillin-binding protein activator n=1 Tax=Alteromonas sp. 5E99-2 TaxID=2817683 RepID=UPI001A9922E2|nr:penicillin-binding protein activator [Alteromonas sp. 5E99-2]MBO1256361.1 penicillin-binding protein activator [Alteromonas sp. 5E99-2]
MRLNYFIYLFALSVVATLLVSGCSNQPTQPQTNTNQVKPKRIEQKPVSRLPSVAQVKQLLEETPLDNEQLLAFTRQFVIAEDYANANALLYAIAPNLPIEYHSQAKTLLALSSSQQTGIPDDWLDVELESNELNIRRIEKLIQSLNNHGKIWQSLALSASLKEQSAQVHHQIFNQLSPLSDKSLNELHNKYSSLRPHITLVKLTRNWAEDNQKLTNAVVQFKQVYNGHPLVTPLPNELTEAMETIPKKLSDVLILLPLSGRFESTGSAIKQGILAAYYDENSDLSPELNFIDTASSSKEEILEHVNKATAVLGPLLKENVDALLPFFPPNTSHLALNRSNQLEYQKAAAQLPTKQTSFFGLAPEDEAIQLAHHVHQSGYKHPIVVASSAGTTKRMLDAFNASWQQTQQGREEKTPVDVVSFDDIDSLDASLSSALGVAQSEANAKQIDRMTNRILYDQTRSRQDIDAIVVFASPEEMALINPMVEASISPFRQQVVPVYAASRSIGLNQGKNTRRDLENVRFVDAPLLIEKDKWVTTNNTLKQLWPDQTASFNRLFAFGFDAYSLLPKLPILMKLPAYQYSGMSGSLQMSDNNELIRTLPMAKIDNDTVNLIKD